MDGLLNLYKPPGISSAKALYRVRKITGVRKSGHAGTLDPAAEGVLLICLGRATKLVEALMNLPKVYHATARLDATSPSFDSEQPPEPVHVARPPDDDEVRAACRRFEGPLWQTPPAVSALKIGGQPAYKLARAGRPVTLPPRRVHIHWLHVRRYSWPEMEFELACGRGAYVRALIRDLGHALGTGGCLTHLIRRAIGPFHLDQARSLEELPAGIDVWKLIVPLETARSLLENPLSIPPRPA